MMEAAAATEAAEEGERSRGDDGGGRGRQNSKGMNESTQFPLN
jgi:hypothetical protein